jgi:hypothetical protein
MREDATIASKICGATPAPLSLANFMLAPAQREPAICVRLCRRGNSLSPKPRPEKICAQSACVEDPFLSWSRNRTVVLTIF